MFHFPARLGLAFSRQRRVLYRYLTELHVWEAWPINRFEMTMTFPCGLLIDRTGGGHS